MHSYSMLLAGICFQLPPFHPFRFLCCHDNSDSVLSTQLAQLCVDLLPLKFCCTFLHHDDAPTEPFTTSLILLLDPRQISNPEAASEADDDYILRVYLHVSRFVVGLRRTGLRTLAVLPSSMAPAYINGALGRGAWGKVAAAVQFALTDQHVEISWARGSPHPLILDLYRRNKSKAVADSLFARCLPDVSPVFYWCSLVRS